MFSIMDYGSRITSGMTNVLWVPAQGRNDEEAQGRNDKEAQGLNDKEAQARNDEEDPGRGDAVFYYGPRYQVMTLYFTTSIRLNNTPHIAATDFFKAMRLMIPTKKHIKCLTNKIILLYKAKITTVC